MFPLILAFVLAGCSTPQVKQLSCPEPRRFNQSQYKWNSSDEEILSFNVKYSRCEANQSELPCVIALHKIGFNDYYVECGAKR